MSALTKKDFVSDQEVRWCPGCGDYVILAQVQRVLAEMGVERENTVFISGIGCSSRFPYYMNTYGFHTIHGRAPTIASGLKSTRNDLSVWLITGDGDGLSIGGNHLIHALRRNFDVNILLFNNRIYGLTKGQFSPTSEVGKKTPSTPMGSLDNPVQPVALALGAGATFVARTTDADTKHLQDILKQAAAHKGSSFVEIYQNCVIFNDGAFDQVYSKENRAEKLLYMEEGQPMVFGKDKDKGIRLNGLNPEVVSLEDGKTDGLLTHQPELESPVQATLLDQMDYPNFPVPMGVFRKVDKPTYNDCINEQIDEAKAKKEQSLEELYNQGETWQVD